LQYLEIISFAEILARIKFFAALQRDFRERGFSPSPVQASKELLEHIPSTASDLALFEAIPFAEILARNRFLDALQQSCCERCSSHSTNQASG
jgi:hypothetical protein